MKQKTFFSLPVLLWFMLAARWLEWQNRFLGSRGFWTPKGLFAEAMPSDVSLDTAVLSAVSLCGAHRLGLRSHVRTRALAALGRPMPPGGGPARDRSRLFA